jgi:beta-glucanase (GH16 family)
LDAWPFDAPQYLLINLAIGGTWGGARGIDPAMTTAQLRVDYVRVYTNSAVAGSMIWTPALGQAHAGTQRSP